MVRSQEKYLRGSAQGCVLALCLSFFWIQRAVGYRDPGNDDSDCATSRKEGCHTASLLAITANGKLLVKDPAKSPDSKGNSSSDSTASHYTKEEKLAIADSIMDGEHGIHGFLSGGTDPSSFKFWFVWTMVSFLLFFICTCFVGSFRAIVFAPVDRQVLGVNLGHVLTCSAEEAQIYATADSSEVIGKVSQGGKVLANGPPEEHKGTTMLPIKPEGAVKLELFRTSQAAHFEEGTVLVCVAAESQPANVFQSTTSTSMLERKISRGAKITAAGKPVWVEGYMMLPVKPEGAVEADLFQIVGEDSAEVPPNLTSEEGEEDQLDNNPAVGEVKERMKQLKKEKTRLMFEQASRKEQLAGVLKGIMDAEAELEGLKEPSAEEVMRKADQAMRSMDAMAEKGVLSAVAYAAPLLTHSKKIYNKLEERMEKTKAECRKLAYQETKNLFGDIAILSGATDLVVDASILDNINSPSVAAILASALAPAQLQILYYFNLMFMVFSVMFVTWDVFVVAWDWQEPCMNHPKPFDKGMTVQQLAHTWFKNAETSGIYLWFFVDFFVHFFCFLIRWAVVRNVGSLLEEVTRPPPLQECDHPIDCLRILLEHYLSCGAVSLIQLDLAMESWSLYLASWSVCFDAIWLVYAVDIVWNTPWVLCDTAGLMAIRMRSTIFLILSLMYLLQIVAFVASHIFRSKGFGIAVLRAADKFDDVLNLGIPLFKILCHALVVRSSSDMISIQLSMHELERSQMKIRREYLERELGDLQSNDDKAKQEMEKLYVEKMAIGDAWQEKEHRALELDRIKKEVLQGSGKFFEDVKKKTAEASARAEQSMEEIERDGIDTSAWSTDFASLQEQGLSAAASAVGAENLQAAQDAAASSSVSGLLSGLADAAEFSTATEVDGVVAQASPDLAAGHDADPPDLAAGGQGARSPASSRSQAPRGSGASMQESPGDDAAGSAPASAEVAASSEPNSAEVAAGGSAPSSTPSAEAQSGTR